MSKTYYYECMKFQLKCYKSQNEQLTLNFCFLFELDSVLQKPIDACQQQCFYLLGYDSFSLVQFRFDKVRTLIVRLFFLCCCCRFSSLILLPLFAILKFVFSTINFFLSLAYTFDMINVLTAWYYSLNFIALSFFSCLVYGFGHRIRILLIFYLSACLSLSRITFCFNNIFATLG